MHFPLWILKTINGHASKGGIVRPKEWALVAIHAAGSRGIGAVKLQKVLFVIGRELPAHLTRRFYTFLAQTYGPHSPALTQHLDELHQSGLIEVFIPEGSDTCYVVTERGRERARRLANRLDWQSRAKVTEITRWVQNSSLCSLIKEICNRYPDFAADYSLWR